MLYLPISLFIFIFLLLHNYISFRPHLFLFHPPQFYHLPSSTFLFPPPQFYYFRSSFLKSLPLHNINISPTPPHSFLSSSFTIFIIFPPQSCFPSSSTILLFSLFHLYLLMYSIHFSIHKYIDLLSTLHRPHIDLSSTPQRPYTQLFLTKNIRRDGDSNLGHAQRPKPERHKKRKYICPLGAWTHRTAIWRWQSV